MKEIIKSLLDTGCRVVVCFENSYESYNDVVAFIDSDGEFFVMFYRR